MNNVVEAVIPARHRSLSGHGIRRLLPSSIRQMVGPFIYFDHIGPERLGSGKGVDVPPHPHIHLATVTYLFQGDLVHRDSLGSLETIRPGDINWMHAGKGIVHSERSGPESRNTESRIHGVQLWVALPTDQEETEPAFGHYPADTLPSWDADGLSAHLLVGAAYGFRSPVKTSSKTLLVDILMKQGASVSLPSEHTNLSVYVINGAISLADQAFSESELIVLGHSTSARLRAMTQSRLLILGGDPLDGKRHIWWNFVSSSNTRIEQARLDWHHDRFPIVPGDEDDRLPFPK